MSFRKAPVLVGAGLLLLALPTWGKGPPIPEPAPDRGSIGVSVKANPPAGGRNLIAVQLYFVRLEEGGDRYRAEFVIPTAFSKKKQVFLLNAKPGRYVAVAAEFRGADYTAFFSKELIDATEVSVAPGELVFLGDLLVDTFLKMKEADEAQGHYYRLISPRAARKGFMARTFSGEYVYRAELLRLDKDLGREREFWARARQVVFKKEPAWQALIDRKMEELAPRRNAGD